MELRDYQRRAVEGVREYLRLLADIKGKTEAAGLGSDLDFSEAAWKKAEVRDNYKSRRDGTGRSIPAFCLKIPTGGGKTLLAVKSIDAVNTLYLKRRTGLVLWVVPTSQIYNQTLKSLRDRQHPYRQHLDVASGGCTVVIERHEAFAPADVAENLVVLMLMLPAANRVTNEQLRMFRDSDGFESFFPSEDDRNGHAAMLKATPNLDAFERDGFWGGQIKTSLGNTLRLLRPIIVLDEGQKAYSENAQKALNGFNPSVIIELSATPPKGSSVLVDIPGVELEREEMIKLDLHVINKASPNWQDTLAAAVEKRDALEKSARKYRAASGTYIRPICL
ncbi:MAG: DEAD/DEAH box helicase family protein, partial [bacterium]|nr:DEAD/DEAH box helicase family protein [bacterium]